MRFSHTRSWLLRSAAIVAAAATGALGPASAQTANLTPANVDTLNLLSPFFTLDSSSIGLQTLQANLSQAVAINANAPAAATLNNNLSTPALAALAISDENLLGSAQNTVYGLSKTVTYGPAANLAGGLPVQQTSGWAEYNGQQAIGGLGAVLGAAFVQGVGSNGATVTLPNTVTLLTDALNQTGNTLWAGQTTSTADSQIAKFYFANGTWNGASAAVAPAGSTLPTSAGLPNGTNSVYDLAYGVTNTQSGQNAYGDSHPYQTANLTLYDPTIKTAMSASVASATSSLAQPKPSSNPSFPSSHMAYAMTDSILLGMLEPQLYQSMLVRASEMGESRIVVGVHYPLDIVASRAFVSYDLVNYLSNPAYIDNAATTGHAIDLPSLMGAAKGELDGLLSAAAVAANCGTSVATCATSSVNVNPYTPSATNAAVYAARTTYGLPTIAGGAKELTDRTGQDASILLATVYGGDSAAAKTLLSGLGMTGGMDGDLSTGSIRQIIANTESDPFSAFVGTQLSYWARINLDAAIGYFSGMTGTLTTADGDHLTIDATVASGGALDVAGRLTIDGAFALAAGGVLGVTLDGRVPETGYSQVEAGGAADLEGGLDVTLGQGFLLRGGDRFDLVHALGGMTDNISALTFDGDACSPLGDEIYRCAVGGHFDVFALPPTGASGTTDLELKLVSTPEPSSWTLIGLGFAGLSAFGRFVLGRGAARLA